MLALYLLSHLLQSTAAPITDYLGNSATLALGEQHTIQTISTIFGTACAALETAATTDVIQRIEERQQRSANLAIYTLPNIARNTIELLGILWFIANSGVWWVFPLAIATSLPSFYFNKKRSATFRAVYRNNTAALRQNTYLNEVLLEREHAIERRLFNFHTRLSAMWAAAHHAFQRKKTSAFLQSLAATTAAMCFSMSTILITGYALFEPRSNGKISIGLFTAILLAVAGSMNMAINSLAMHFTALREIADFGADLATLELTRNSAPAGQTVQPQQFESLEFENVWFRYSDDSDYILKGVSFKIHRNECVALVGVNGAGKTTLTRLMLGIHRPQHGKILLNGKDTAICSEKELSANFALVNQNFARYKDTLAVNVALYSIAAGNTAIEHSLSHCGAAELAEKSRMQALRSTADRTACEARLAANGKPSHWRAPCIPTETS